MKKSVPPRLLWAVTLVLGAGLTGFLAWRMLLTAPHRSDLPLTETHRTNLVLHAGHWQLRGTTNNFNGLLLDTYDDGSRKSLSLVSNGLLQGVSRGWHTNGQQQVEEHFVAGTSHGLRTKWHPNGRKLSEITVVDGKLHGTFRRWDDQGRLMEEIEMKEGQPDGISKSYFPSGFVKAEVVLRNGQVVSRQSWTDQELQAATTSQPDNLSTR